jgi:hypothetical protein
MRPYDPPPRFPSGPGARRLSELAELPVRGSALAAGYDLAAARPCTIPARGKGPVQTDLAILVPEGCYGRIGAAARARGWNRRRWGGWGWLRCPRSDRRLSGQHLQWRAGGGVIIQN